MLELLWGWGVSMCTALLFMLCQSVIHNQLHRCLQREYSIIQSHHSLWMWKCLANISVWILLHCVLVCLCVILNTSCFCFLSVTQIADTLTRGLSPCQIDAAIYQMDLLNLHRYLILNANYSAIVQLFLLITVVCFTHETKNCEVFCFWNQHRLMQCRAKLKRYSSSVVV